MRILIIPFLYMPDGGPSAPLFSMLADGLAKRGHSVTVIAAMPHYPSGRVIATFRGKLILDSNENGVDVIRVFVPSGNRTNLINRFVQFMSYQSLSSLLGIKKNYDVLIVANPALETFLPFFFLSVLKRKPAISSVHDVYPDVGVALGIFRHKFVIAAVGYLERYFLKRSCHVRILSDSFIQPLQSLGIPKEKMKLIYDWVDTDLIQPLPKDNSFSREHNLCGRFVVMYAGNIGLSQGLEHVLEAATLLKDHQEISFAFVGEGAGRPRLMTRASQLNLHNVQFIPFQPRSRLPEVLAAADISLVILKQGIGAASLPSKSFSILASGRPILASVDKDSDTWKLVQRSNAGVCVLPENPAALADAILALKQNPARCEALGKNGRVYALQYHSPHAATKEFEKLLYSAIINR